jgi:tetratricopeptide (TPR) repeat protein
LIVVGENHRLQTVSGALSGYLNASGRWDEWLALSLRGEQRAVEKNDFLGAGWRAFDAGWAFWLRREVDEILACAERATKYWEQAKKAGPREHATALRLTGIGLYLKGRYSDATDAFEKALVLFQQDGDSADNVASVHSDLGDAKYIDGDYTGAESEFQEALRIAKDIGGSGVATYTGNLASCALARKDWTVAERLAREALTLAENLGHKELIVGQCVRLAEALLGQGLASRALPFAQRALDMSKALRMPLMESVRTLVKTCEQQSSLQTDHV